MKYFQGFVEPSAAEDGIRSAAMRDFGLRADGDHVLLAVVRDGHIVLCALERVAEGGKNMMIMTDLDRGDLRMKVLDV